MKIEENINEQKVGAIEKTLQILNAFSEKPYHYSAKDLSTKLKFSKPTVHRILKTLEKEHYLRHISETKYTIGYKAYQMGMVYANNIDIYLEIRRVIEDVANITGEQVGYAVLEGIDVVSVYESQLQDARIRYIAGVIYPINSGCYGKVLMAFTYSKEELIKIVPTLTLKQVSSGAIMDHTILLEEYLTIKRNGYAQSIDEYLDGTVGIAVPVLKRDGSLAGCIALGSVKSQKFEEKIKSHISKLLEAAKELETVFL